MVTTTSTASSTTTAEEPVDPPYDHPPIFVGGSGRSGTTIVARLVGSHPDFHTIPIEAKFHCMPNGVTDVMDGRATPQQFVRHLQERYYFQGWEGGSRGIHWLHSGRRVWMAAKQFVEAVESDPERAGRRIIRELLDPLAGQGRGWVEMTPQNIRNASELGRLFPEARFVHCIRDGRDVASSVVPLAWGPDDHDAALAWWAAELRAADRAAAAIGRDRVFDLHLEELAGPDGAHTCRALLRFCGLDEDPAVAAFFSDVFSTERAHRSRWQDDFDRVGRFTFERTYRRHLRALRAEGVRCLPVPP